MLLVVILLTVCENGSRRFHVSLLESIFQIPNTEGVELGLGAPEKNVCSFVV